MVDAGGEAEVEMLLDDLPCDRADIFVADAGIVLALRLGIAVGRETERTAILVEEIFLLEAEPGPLVIENRCALVRRSRRPAP